MNVVRTLELCAGVGMLGEGLHAGIRYLGGTARAVGYCERDAYAASILLARMEDEALEPAPVWAGNLEDVRWEQFHGAVDCVLAGFPCQPHSMAGSRKGTDDQRWIWPAIADAVLAIRPGIVFLENVSGLRSSGGFAPVLADLAALGFAIEWDSVRASDLGASHQRERVFILSYRPEFGRLKGRAESARIVGRFDADKRGGAVADSESACRCQSESKSDPGATGRRGWDGPFGIGCELDYSDRNGAQRTRRAQPCACAGCGEMGHAGLQHQHQEQRPDGSEYQGAGGGVPGVGLADACRPRLPQRRVLGRNDGAQQPSVERDCDTLFAPGPDSPSWAGIISEARHLTPALERGVRVLADGMAVVLDASRQDQLRCVGNGVVPLQAALGFVQLARRSGIA